jgi:hypothetical protein
MVHILATCKNPSLFDYTRLVFKTLRVGFPTADVTVHLNALSDEQAKTISSDASDCLFECVDTIHHDWINSLIDNAEKPFWILDTDVVFYASMEDFQPKECLAGYRIPEFYDRFSGCITRSRLHTSLLYFDPEKIKEAMLRRHANYNRTEFTPLANLINPLCFPLRGKMYFHDTCSMLYHAVGGESFSPIEKNRYFHFHYGTIGDRVIDRLDNPAVMKDARKLVLSQPALGCGLWREQDEYFNNRQP